MKTKTTKQAFYQVQFWNAGKWQTFGEYATIEEAEKAYDSLTFANHKTIMRFT